MYVVHAPPQPRVDELLSERRNLMSLLATQDIDAFEREISSRRVRAIEAMLAPSMANPPTAPPMAPAQAAPAPAAFEFAPVAPAPVAAAPPPVEAPSPLAEWASRFCPLARDLVLANANCMADLVDPPLDLIIDELDLDSLPALARDHILEELTKLRGDDEASRVSPPASPSSDALLASIEERSAPPTPPPVRLTAAGMPLLEGEDALPPAADDDDDEPIGLLAPASAEPAADDDDEPIGLLAPAPAEPAWLAGVKELLALAEKKSGIDALRGALTARSWSCGPPIRHRGYCYFDASVPSDWPSFFDLVGREYQQFNDVARSMKQVKMYLARAVESAAAGKPLRLESVRAAEVAAPQTPAAAVTTPTTPGSEPPKPMEPTVDKRVRALKRDYADSSDQRDALAKRVKQLEKGPTSPRAKKPKLPPGRKACPSCGAIVVGPTKRICPSCGHDFFPK